MSPRPMIRMLAVSAAVMAGLVLPSTAGATTTLRNFIVKGRTGACQSIDSTGAIASSVSQTGIAFDGTSLYMSCWGDNTIAQISPATSSESQTAAYAISGGSEFGALAWDATRGVLWACKLTPGHEQTSTDVGQIDLGTSTFTHVFNSQGCDNGLAYDFTDDTLWASTDVATTVQHYSVAGTLLSSTPLPSAVGSNSGIAVAAGHLYFANPMTTTKKIFQVDRGLTSSTLVASLNLRYEDMECDGETFPGKTGLWVQTNKSNRIRAYQISDTCSMGAPSAVLAASQTAVPSSVAADQNVTYTVTVTDTGSADATGTTVMDTLPGTSILDSATPSQGGCSGTGPITCSLGTIAAGGSATITVVVTPVQPETATNKAVASSPDASSQATTTASATVTSSPTTKYVNVTSAGFSPSPTTLAGQGWTVQWYFTSSGSATDDSGMGLFDSGTRTPIDYYAFTFTGAGSYSVTDSPAAKTTSVKVPVSVSPASGSTSTAFTVTWASTPPPAGYAEDIQVKDPGTTSWVNWQTGQAGTSASFTPDHGAGTYSFRARLRNTNNAKASSYSAATSISVS